MPPHFRQWCRQFQPSKGAWQPRQTAVSSSPNQRGAKSCMLTLLVDGVNVELQRD